MATRGCTSRAASRDPQVFRVPCAVILSTHALMMQRSKLRLKFLGSQRRAVAGGEHQAGIDPSSVSPAAVGLLLFPAELERGHG
jgi:hypothetical protein